MVRRRGLVSIVAISGLTLGLFVFSMINSPPSSGQRMSEVPTNRKPACTIFCGDATMNYIVLDRPPACFGGPLPADNAPAYPKDLSNEDRKRMCQNLKSADKSATSCPAFKQLMQSCNEQEGPPENKCKKPSAPWLGSPPTECKDFQGWQVEQTGGTVSLYVCGYRVYSNPTVGTDKLFSAAYVGALKLSVRDSIGDKLCCDTFREAARTGNPCDPRSDLDCDGKPNAEDHDGSFPTIDLNYTTAQGANIDPFPPGMNAGEIYPNQFACKDCQWELMRGQLKCSPDGKQKHVYQAKWKCPLTGVEADTFKYAPATEPCEPPRRGSGLVTELFRSTSNAARFSLFLDIVNADQ